MNIDRFKRDVMPLKNRFFRLAMNITLNREEAEDVVQETLLRIWKEMGDDGRETRDERAIRNVEAFGMTVCRNRALDAVTRRERRNLSLDESEHDCVDTAIGEEERMIRDERINSIKELMTRLPEKQRTAMMLRDVDGKNYAEIAQIMGNSEADVKVNIFRARQKIRILLNNKQ